MADEADVAFAAEHQALTSAIEANRKSRHRMQPIGACHYCDTTLGSVKLFCDSDCASDWDRENRLRIAAGKPSLAAMH